jgi:hypothetical protein
MTRDVDAGKSGDGRRAYSLIDIAEDEALNGS